jgi:hypothetical protein
MAQLVRIRFYQAVAAYLIIAVSAVLMLAAMEHVRSVEFETSGPISGSSYLSQVAAIDCLAVIPRIGQNTLKNAFLRLGSLRFLLPFGIYNGITALCKSPFAGTIPAHPVDINNSIPLKLRV